MAIAGLRAQSGTGSKAMLLKFTQFAIPLFYLALSFQLLSAVYRKIHINRIVLNVQYFFIYFLFFLLFSYITAEYNRFPVGNSAESLYLAVIILTVTIMVLELFLKERSFSFIVMPITFILATVASIRLNPEQFLDPKLWSLYWPFHASFTIVSFVFIFLSVIFALLYLLKYSRLKQRQSDNVIATNIPSLEGMERYMKYFVYMGITALGLGLLMGFLWIDHLNYRHQDILAGSTLFYKIIFTLTTWFLYIIVSVLNRFEFVNSRRFSIFLILSFLFVIITLSLGDHAL